MVTTFDDIDILSHACEAHKIILFKKTKYCAESGRCVDTGSRLRRSYLAGKCRDYGHITGKFAGSSLEKVFYFIFFKKGKFIS